MNFNELKELIDKYEITDFYISMESSIPSGPSGINIGTVASPYWLEHEKTIHKMTIYGRSH